MKCDIFSAKVLHVFISVLLLAIIVPLLAEEDLYRILGVKKSASGKDIKQAYKQLAKEWHPDKNRDPEANEIFMKINEAYETLGDATKRREYDQFGTTSAQAQQGRQQHHGGHDPFAAFESFFQGGSFSFGGGQGGGNNFESTLDKHRVTFRSYESKVLPESNAKPYLLYAYSDFCYQCMQVELIWDRVVHDLESIGMGVGTVHAQMERRLIKQLRITTVPTIFAIFQGKIHWFSRSQISVQEIRDFVRGLMPPDGYLQLTDKNYNGFLDGWNDNRVRMIFFGNRATPSMRFTLAAFAFRDRVAAGFVYNKQLGSADLRRRYNVGPGHETLLMFAENSEAPIASMTSMTIPRSSFDELIESNQYLTLPRLSSHAVFNTLCPTHSTIRKKKLCVVLLTRNHADHDRYRTTFRQYAMEHFDAEQRVKYAYVWEDTQSPFVSAITRGAGVHNSTEDTLKVAVIWRQTPHKLLYDWLEGGWSDSEVPRARRRLHQLVDWVLAGSDVLPYVMTMSEDLRDEHQSALLWRMIQKIKDWINLIWERLLNLDEMAVITLVTTVTFVVIVGFMMRALVGMEDQHIPKSPPQQRRHQHRHRPTEPPTRPTLYVHPLCVDNFDSVVMDVDPGVRTIVLLVDEATQHKLLQQFAAVVEPYTRSDAFVCGFLQLEQYLPWYRHLLEETLDFKRDLTKINPKNCIGTVLALNGPRKYYCMYSAQRERQQRMAQAAEKGGEFLGLDDSDAEGTEAEELARQKLFESDLLASLGMWMERLCEGTLQRYRVDYWPRMES